MIFRNINILINIIFIYNSENILYYFHNSKKKYYFNIINRITSLDIFFIKIMQWILNYGTSNIFENDKEILNLLNMFSNNVPFSEKDIDNKEIEVFKNKHNDLLMEKIPINSGTIAIIYKGVYKNNQVIIKIKRKNIKEEIVKSISFFNFLVYLINFIPKLRHAKLDKIIEENSKNLINQVNFKSEANNISKFYEFYKDNDSIYTPFVYHDLCDENIIVMEYLDGINPQYLKKKNESDKRSQLPYDFFLFSLFNHNIIHSDLHKGNVLFLKDESGVGIIDFGLIKKITDYEKKMLISFFIGFFSTNTIFKKILFSKLIVKLDKNKNVDYDAALNDRDINDIILKMRKSGILIFFEIDFTLNKYNLKMRKELFSILIDIGPFIDLVHYLTKISGYPVSRASIINLKKSIIKNNI